MPTDQVPWLGKRTFYRGIDKNRRSTERTNEQRKVAGFKIASGKIRTESDADSGSQPRPYKIMSRPAGGAFCSSFHF